MTQHIISHVAMPSRLILAWQAPDEMGDRYRFAVGELTRVEHGLRLRYFAGAEYEQLNPDKSIELRDRLGYRGYPGFSPSKPEHVTGVYEAFLRRIPPRSRSDFPFYQRSLRVASHVELTEFQLLGLSEAVLPSDGFSIVDPLTPDAQAHEMFLEVAGYRYYAKGLTPPGPQPGDAIEIVPEPDNPYDADAVMIIHDRDKVGHINRLQTEAFNFWAREGRISAVVDRVNGTVEKPRLLLFVSITAAEAHPERH